MTCRDVPGQPGHPSSYPEGRTYLPLAKQAVVCPWHRALFEEDASSAEAVGQGFFYCGVHILACAECQSAFSGQSFFLPAQPVQDRYFAGTGGPRRLFLITQNHW